ncbi:hypothetical protein PI124_g8803 [Phytophthora idaei]|nr:hypothetical protein PI125_g16700 [Phytophthora idaei]KAG3141233.1 hypothetical protein PI126_g15583 [Phytophthora idaei]KAG3246482.1 hypothetical protein PI124_g8803 [Phytophthora idaei]
MEEGQAAGQTECNTDDMCGVRKRDDDDYNGNNGVLASQTTRTVRQVVDSLSPAIDDLLQDYMDCFPEELPNKLPVSRTVEFSLIMKPDARSSPRVPLRLSKTEQGALKRFVDELLRKQ